MPHQLAPQYSFGPLSDEAFDEFSSTHPLNNFTQSLDLAASQRSRGMDVELLGVTAGGRVLAAARVLYTSGRFGYRAAVAEKGPLLDYTDAALLQFFTESIRSYLKNKGVLELVISPYLPYVHRDEDGAEHPEVLDNSPLISQLAALGYAHQGFEMNFANINWMFVKDLAGIADSDALLMSTGYRTRKAVRKSAKNGVYVEEATEETLQEFFDTVEAAGDEKGFTNRPIEYYRNLLQTTRPGFTKLMMAKINLTEFRNRINAAISEESTINSALRIEVEATGSKKKTSKLKVSDELLESYHRSLADVAHFNAAHGTLTLAAIYFACFGSEVVCVIGGSNAEYIYFNGATALYWHMLEYALENGFAKYNFYGTFGIGTDDAASGHGGYEFKKGFGGNVVQLIGEFVLPVKPAAAKTFSLLRRAQAKLGR